MWELILGKVIHRKNMHVETEKMLTASYWSKKLSLYQNQTNCFLCKKIDMIHEKNVIDLEIF